MNNWDRIGLFAISMNFLSLTTMFMYMVFQPRWFKFVLGWCFFWFVISLFCIFFCFLIVPLSKFFTKTKKHKEVKQNGT